MGVSSEEVGWREDMAGTRLGGGLEGGVCGVSGVSGIADIAVTNRS